MCATKTIHLYAYCLYCYIYCIGGTLRTINLAVFVDFTATSKLILENLIVYKCNDSLVDPRNLIRDMYHLTVTSKIFSLENYLIYSIHLYR